MKIFDTSSIICIFREIESPKFFENCKRLGYDLCITPQVYEELKRNPETFKLFSSFDDFNIISDIDLNCFNELSRRYPWLHDGEISVLCSGVYKKRHNEHYHCVIDERARKLKDELGIKINGTIGLIVWQKKLLGFTEKECNLIYNKFLNSSFWVKNNILQELLK